MAYQSTNPYDGCTPATFDEHDGATLEPRQHAAADCFERDWRQRSCAEPAVVLHRAAALMRERRDGLARAAASAVATRAARNLRKTTLEQVDCAVAAGTRASMGGARMASIEAVVSGDPPHHLLLGKGAFEGAMAKVDELRSDFTAGKAVALGAHFPGVLA